MIDSKPYKQLFSTGLDINNDVKSIGLCPNINLHKNITQEMSFKTILTEDEKRIIQSLKKVSIPLANSLIQIKLDISSPNRLSWAGTAHEIRQLLATLLELLAPDEKVVCQVWYKQDSQTNGPTQKQRVHYILLQKHYGSKEREVAEYISEIDTLIESLIRATYSRASDAAHRTKTKHEVVRIYNYFVVFVQDLLIDTE